MKKLISLILVLTISAIFLSSVAVSAVDAAVDTAVTENTAAAEEGASSTGTKAVAAGIAVGVAASCGAVAMGLASAKASDGVARQPEAAGQIRSSMMLSLVFIETAIIYALIVAILIIFVL